MPMSLDFKMFASTFSPVSSFAVPSNRRTKLTGLLQLLGTSFPNGQIYVKIRNASDEEKEKCRN